MGIVNAGQLEIYDQIPVELRDAVEDVILNRTPEGTDALLAIADKYKLPVHAIGVGEAVDDLQPFDARDFARAIAGL